MEQRPSPSDGGQDGRSVLGMLAVQVEKDPKTGTTVVKSVEPVSSPASPSMTAAIFDDGRKSIHALGGSAGEASPEEIQQILRVVSGVGMNVLLDEAAAATQVKAKTRKVAEISRNPQEKLVSFVGNNVISPVDCSQSNRLRKPNTERNDILINNTFDEDALDTTEEHPVQLIFMGYTDSPCAIGEEEHDRMLTAERVVITDEGEELVLEPEASFPALSPSQEATEPETLENPSPEKTLDSPVEGNRAGTKAEGQESDGAEQKTCRCCSVM